MTLTAPGGVFSCNILFACVTHIISTNTSFTRWIASGIFKVLPENPTFYCRQKPYTITHAENNGLK